jgi:hypothetical protein
VVVTFAFLLTRVLGDPVRQMLPLEHTREEYQNLRQTLGYDRPWAVQYAAFLRGLVRGDLGTSTAYNRPALEVVLGRLPVTAGLAGAALLVAVLVGVPLGVLAGYRPYGPIDRLSLVVATVGQAVPAFVIAILLILLFAVNLRWLPAGGSPPGRHVPAGGRPRARTMSGRSGWPAPVSAVMARPSSCWPGPRGWASGRSPLHALGVLLPVVTFGGLNSEFSSPGRRDRVSSPSPASDGWFSMPSRPRPEVVRRRSDWRCRLW